MITIDLAGAEKLRYGENPHQKGWFLPDSNAPPGTLGAARQIQGKEMSYNNWVDADAGLECVRGFEKPACVMVKHANPCGVAFGCDILDAYSAAYTADPVSAFGSVVAFNRVLGADTARYIVANKHFTEVIVAPSIFENFENETTDVLRQKENIRVLLVGSLSRAPDTKYQTKRIIGGLLIQENDTCVFGGKLKIVTDRKPTESEERNLRFAFRVAKFVKSNAIVFVRDERTVGIGAGQMNRKNSVRIAAEHMNEFGLTSPNTDTVMASDAFFPFRDGIDAAAEAGITAVIQPGGSFRDDEVIAAANEHGMAMIFTGMRHFRH
ncbi:bifunctional phosphoribosylaminoimidazolecarboxamide formyltransferase/IMP cyclohydrolase [bacterium]|nr:bifunctional phosphoribosylaminoimidazolecarboxamide formyltransferase/IMP cyclohydrolase [bacterium]